jgi:lipopolysaccharide transport system permease protein
LLQTRTIVIDATRPLHGLNPRELWEYRDLFLVFIQRDLKLRYRQTLLGVIWAVLQPVLPMIVFTLLFGRLAHMPADGLPYPIFVYAGLLAWTFFNTAVTNATASIVGSAAFVTKVYFPRVLLPGSCVFGGLIDLAISGVVFFGMMLYYRLHLTSNLLIVPALLVLITMLTLAVGMWTSAMNVKYRDVRYALPFVLQVWMYLTPVIYPVTFIPQRFRWLLNINPLSGIIEGFRSAFFGQPLHWFSLGMAAGSTAILLLCGTYSFRQMERQMADII